jgi:hypothetical protein
MKRLENYTRYRAYYFFGALDQNSAWNLIYSHLDMISSFLYASDSTRFSCRMGTHAQQPDNHRTGPFAKLVMENWKQSNADVIYQMGILWALIYDSTIIKHIRRGGEVYPYIIDPSCFGVYREDIPMLDRQEAFVHVYYITKSALEKRLALHPKRDEIIKKAEDSFAKIETATQAPSLVNQIILSSGMPGIPMQSVIGQGNTVTAAPNDFVAQMDVPVVEMQEVYVWNDEIDDYQVITLASGTNIVYDRQNIFLPKSPEFEGEHGFVQLCPNPLPDYFFGQSEISKLYPIQDKLNDRMLDIERLEKKQIDPPSAWGGMGLPDKLDAFNSPGANIAIGDPSFKRETFVPQIPEHVYAAVQRFQDQMDTVSGLSNVVQGKGESGVRSAGHASKLLTVGSSRVKKRAQIIEDAIEKGATIYGRCAYVDETEPLLDDTGVPFIPNQMDPHFFVEIDAHSNSPIFEENQKELALMLLKTKAITRERFIQMLHPPMEQELLRDLKEKIIPGEEKAAKAQAEASQAKAIGGK